MATTASTTKTTANPQVITQGTTAPGGGVVNFNPQTGAKLSQGQSVNAYTGALVSGGSSAPATPQPNSAGAAVTQPTQQTTQTSAAAPTATQQKYDPTVLNTPNVAPAAPAALSAPTSGGQQSVGDRMKQGLATSQASGAAAPDSIGGGAAAAAKNTPAAPKGNTLAGVFQATPQLQQALDQQATDRTNYLNSQNQQQTLQQQYKQMVADAGVEELNTQLMNMKNVIDGTEDDIRNEVTKAGGFATNSQVLALTDARNKVVIQNYNNLLQTKQNAMEQINTQIGLSKEDKANAMAEFNQQMSFDQQQISMGMQMQNNAQQSLQKIVDTVGYDGLLKETNNDPYYKNLVEQTLGLGDGGLAKLAAQPNLDRQIKQGQLQLQQSQLKTEAAQRANISSEIHARNIANSNTTTLDASGIPTSLSPYLNTSSSGVKYIDASSLEGTAKEKTQLINQATAAGLKVITNKNTAADLINIQDANSKLDTIQTTLAGIGQPGWVSRTLGGLGMTKLSTALQSNPQKAAAGALQSVGLDILKAISGVQGFRGNATAVQQVTDHLPKVTDTVDTINQKVSYVKQLISDRENAALGVTNNGDQTVGAVTYSKGADGLYYPKQ